MNQRPDFTRLAWVSEQARATWAPRINNINGAWARMERWAVVEGIRNSALTFFEPDYLPEATAWAARHGLIVLPLARVGIADQYSATPKAVSSNDPWQYRVVLTRQQYAARWLEAWADTGQDGRYKGTNNRALGELLGYPTCCIDFFERTWVNEGSVDTTYDMTTDGTVGPPEANILLRWLGVRLVAHLPCSFHCEETVAIGKLFAEVGRRRHFGEWVDWTYEMLSWPVEWSGLHGIAEVRTPIVTITTRTNTSPSKLVVQRQGTGYPPEGASGLRFPYRIVTGRVSEKPAFKRAQQPTYALNGFSSADSMATAHAAVLTLLPSTSGTLLDLGCGNGELLRRAEERGWVVFGVEQDYNRAAQATVPVKCGDIFDITLWEGQFDVVLFMPGRLTEVSPEQAIALVLALAQRAQSVILYAYGDWMNRFTPMLADLPVATQQAVTTPDVEACLVQFVAPEGVPGAV